jgi:CheY-like chemotaxis protein
VKPIDPRDAVVLAVEDNADNLYILLDLLRDEVKVKHCDGRPSGMLLFGLLAANPRMKVDLILLDIMMPHEDGYFVFEQLRKRPLLQDTKMVACTSNAFPEEISRARKLGFHGFIGKPITEERFPEQIRRILAGEPVWEL